MSAQAILKSRSVLRTLVAVTLLGAGAYSLDAQSGAKNGEWPTYGGDLGNTRYSPLDQINAANFNKLESPGASRPKIWARGPNISLKPRR